MHSNTFRIILLDLATCLFQKIIKEHYIFLFRFVTEILFAHARAIFCFRFCFTRTTLLENY